MKGWDRGPITVAVALIIMVAAAPTTFAEEPQQAPPAHEVRVAFDELQAHVISVGGLNEGQRRSLGAKLDAAEAAYERGQACTTTLQNLRAFMNEARAIGDRNAQLGDDLYRRGWLLQFEVIEHLPSGMACEIGIQWIVDESLTPTQPDLPGLDGGPLRPLAAIEGSGGGAKVDFVANEIVVTSEDPSVPVAVAARWSGVVVSQYDPSSGGFSGSSQYLLRVNSASADTSRLAGNLATVSPDVQEALRFSSDAGARLFAVATAERASGLEIGVNFVGEPDTFRDLSSLEAPVGDAGFSSSSSSYVREAFDWHFLNSRSEQDIGVTRAWLLLERAGRLGNRTSIGIHDGGFAPDADFPPGGSIDQPGVEGNGKCGGGSDCPWHGTNVVHAAMAVPDNGFGSAGPGGPVGIPVTRTTGRDTFSAISEVDGLIGRGAKIVNMSWSVEIPAAAVPFSRQFEFATAMFAARGTLLIASAGNESKDVDATDCFLACWEEESIEPCENAGVVCVGALGLDSRRSASYSNWGHENVDIFAPGTVLVGLDPEAKANRTDAVTDYAQSVNGTSFASPYVAGVAALVRAADPGLEGGAIWSIIRQTAHLPSFSYEESYVNALAAVEAALPALINIEYPADGASFPRGVTVMFSSFVHEAGRGRPSIRWSSDRDGAIGSNSDFSTIDLSFGRHTITAEATFPDGTVSRDSIAVTITNTAPTIEILQPMDRARVFSSQIIRFEGRSFDQNNVENSSRLNSDQVSWHLDGSGTPFATGHSVRQALNLATGNHTVTFRGTDGEFVATDTITLNVTADPSDLPPSVEIVEPREGQVFFADRYDESRGEYYALVTLDGRASDPEDGRITSGDRFNWVLRSTASPETWAHLGPTVLARLYLPAATNETTFTIDLTVRDSAGNLGEDEIHVGLTTLI